MQLTGDILQIKNKRDNVNESVALHIDTIEYVTYKKDGKYFQPFDYVDELEKPFVLTGDCLARIPNKHLEDGEFEFEVYDKVGDDYELNPNKKLAVTMAFVEEADQVILTSIEYTVTVSNEEFQEIKRERFQAQKQKKGKKRR